MVQDDSDWPLPGAILRPQPRAEDSSSGDDDAGVRPDVIRIDMGRSAVREVPGASRDRLWTDAIAWPGRSSFGLRRGRWLITGIAAMVVTALASTWALTRDSEPGSPSDPTIRAITQQAFGLTPAEASAQLAGLARQGRRSLVGRSWIDRWVPELALECEGMSLPLDDDWAVAPESDAVRLGPNEILAHQLVLAARHGAITVTPEDVGMDPDAAEPADPEECRGREMWLSLVLDHELATGPSGAGPAESQLAISTSEAVLAWCARQAGLGDQCRARRLAAPFSRSSTVTPTRVRS